MAGRIFLLFLVLGTLLLVIEAQDPPVVKVAYIADGRPVSWDDHGNPAGFEPAIVDLCVAKLGLRAQHVFLPWTRAQLAVESGEADLMVTTPTDDRFRYGIFGKEKVILVGFKLYTNKANKTLIAKASRFTSLEDLRPYTLVDYPGNGWTKSYLPGYKVVQTYQINQIPLVLKSNRADFCIIYAEMMRQALTETKTTDDITEVDTDLPHTKFHYVFIVSRKSPWAAQGLVKGLDRALTEIKKTGDWAKVFERYQSVPVDESRFQTEIDTRQYYTGYDQYPDYRAP